MVKRKCVKETLFITSSISVKLTFGGQEHDLNRFGFTPRYMTATEAVVIIILLS